MKPCEKCIHYDVCLLHEDNFIDDAAKNGFCGKFKNKADFVEVVYCKECSWSTERTKDNELFQYQCRNTVACGKPRRACDFCSCGARRDT